ncbi:MAG: class I SAM-dependent methyltransferase [Planctomycetaceae bacterium]|jgi:23S rRNA (cytosine1962-C5)-methyltransferase|nr:class I SAM-dependent methyltransferase [Planctomycetaceae bacterium]
MFPQDQYELIDFGHGRRLERFGPLILDRPCPSAAGIPMRKPEIWQTADVRFLDTGKTDAKNDPQRGEWQSRTDAARRIFEKTAQNSSQNSRSWTISGNRMSLELRGTPFGHVGIFPEQMENWRKIHTLCQRFAEPPKILNLFAYTGGSTLAAAKAGAEVTHLDSAKNILAWGKQNAAISGRMDHPVRWIAEDAWKFVTREKKRGNPYQGIILDPPSYGHGVQGEVWRLSKHLPGLLADCFSLLKPNEGAFLLLTAHTPGYTLPKLAEMVLHAAQKNWGADAGEMIKGEMIKIEKKPMVLVSRFGAELRLGESVLFCYNNRS